MSDENTISLLGEIRRLNALVLEVISQRDAAKDDLTALVARVKAMCPCRCHEAYKGRGLIDPECPWHQYGDEILCILTDET